MDWILFILLIALQMYAQIFLSSKQLEQMNFVFQGKYWAESVGIKRKIEALFFFKKIKFTSWIVPIESIFNSEGKRYGKLFNIGLELLYS